MHWCRTEAALACLGGAAELWSALVRQVGIDEVGQLGGGRLTRLLHGEAGTQAAGRQAEATLQHRQP